MKSFTHQLRVAAGGVLCGAACMMIALLTIGRLWPVNAEGNISQPTERSIVSAENN